MVPGLVGRIAELLASIDQKLDKVNVVSAATDNTPELMDIKQLGAYLPSHLQPSTIYGWCSEGSIPITSRASALSSRNRRLTVGCCAAE